MPTSTSGNLSAATIAKIKEEITQLEEEIKAAKKLTDPKAAVDFHESVFADDLIDIHASGWIYSRAQSIELEKNMAATPRSVKVLRSTTSEHHIRILAENVVLVSGLVETYFEAPNPQTQSLEAGTFTMSPEATAKISPPAFGPGEDYAPNPYRTRITRIWVRSGTTWKLAVSQATRLGKRVRVGLV
jgi:hypothetical protein